jgi:hypothetical protein
MTLLEAKAKAQSESAKLHTALIRLAVAEAKKEVAKALKISSDSCDTTFDAFYNLAKELEK